MDFVRVTVWSDDKYAQKIVLMVRGSSFRSDFLQNSYFNFTMVIHFLVTLFSSNSPALRRTCHAIEVSSLRKTRAVLAASAAAALQLHFVHFLSFSGFALCRAPLPLHSRDRRRPRRALRRLKGQLNSEWIYEVIVSPKMPTKNYKDFCPTKQTRIVAKKTLPTIN